MTTEENQHQKNGLENNFFYRLVKVAYILSFIAVSLVVIVLGWSERPTKYVDSKKSYLSCDNGKSYTLETAKIYVWSDDTELDSYDDKDARKVCAYAITDDYLDKYQTPNYKNYTLQLNHSIRGSWQSALLWWFIGISTSYIVLNLIRETLLYIMLGKKFSWDWFIRVWNALNEKQQ